VAGRRDGERLALKIYVERKAASSVVDYRHRVPTTLQLPTIASDIPTDVEAIGRQELQLKSDRVRPIAPGYSLGLVHPRTTGTLSCVVRDRNDPSKFYVLSNSHVLAGAGVLPAGTDIVQPGPDDAGVPTDVVASLTRVVPFNFDAGYNNFCDAALGELSESIMWDNDIPDIGVVTRVNANLSRGMQIQKTGRTTGHTVGTIKDLDYQTFMPYPKPGGGIADAGFRSQVLCTRYGDGGDSGSLVCDMQGSAVGLHWCGSNSASVFSPIRFVLDGLSVDIPSGA
jgi:hypothetical protein